MGRNSSVGIATRYGLDGPGSDPVSGPDFPYSFRPVLGPIQPLWVSFLGLSGGVVALTNYPNLVGRLKKELSYTSTLPQRLHGLF